MTPPKPERPEKPQKPGKKKRKAALSDLEPAPPSQEECIFCRIVAGELPSWQVYADEHAVAFLDINAWHRGHTLVIPRRHVVDVVAGEPSLPEIAPAIDTVARLLDARLAPDGMNILSSAGRVAGQTVFHAHVHVIPRYADQPGFTHLVNPGDVPEGELESVWRQVSEPS